MSVCLSVCLSLDKSECGSEMLSNLTQDEVQQGLSKVSTTCDMPQDPDLCSVQNFVAKFSRGCNICRFYF